MGASLPKGGPAGLFLGFVVYGTVIWSVNQCFGKFPTHFSPGTALADRAVAEMVTYLPIASPFIRLGGFWVDDAWGFAMGWNYFFLMGKSFGPLHFCSLTKFPYFKPLLSLMKSRQSTFFLRTGLTRFRWLRS